MIIFVFGNINSGKTTLIREIEDNFPDYPVLSIDEYRIKYGDNSIEREEVAVSNFINDIFSNDKCIVEFTGRGNIADRIIERLSGEQCLILKLDTDEDICISRIEEKDFNAIPYPFKKLDIADTINDIDIDFKKGFIEENWGSKVLNIITVNDGLLLKEIVKRYVIIEQVVHELKSYDKNMKILLVGSLPTLDITIVSDIDIYVVSNNFIALYKYLATKDFNNFGKDKNKIYYYIDKILIELNVVTSEENIVNNRLVYNSKLIDSASSLYDNEKRFVILNGNFDVNLLNEKNHLMINEEELVDRLMYYYRRLPSILESNDDYKFNFYHFIVVHEYVRIVSLRRNGIDSNYLPSNAYNFLSDKEKNLLSIGKQYRSKTEKLKCLIKLLKNQV